LKRMPIPLNLTEGRAYVELWYERGREL